MQELAGFILMTSLISAAVWVVGRYGGVGMERESPLTHSVEDNRLARRMEARLPVGNAPEQRPGGALNAGSTELGSDQSSIAWLPFLMVIVFSLITAQVSATQLDSIVRQPEDIGLPPNPTVDSWFGEPADCGEDGFFSPVCDEYRPVGTTLLATALPGLLSALPFLWLLYRDSAVRMAALVAGSLGAVRFAAPIVLLLLDSKRITAPSGQDYFEYGLGDPASIWIWLAAVLVSIVSLLTSFAFARGLSRRSAGKGV